MSLDSCSIYIGDGYIDATKPRKHRFNWDRAFALAHLHSGPGMASHCISNTKPPHETAWNVYQQDKEKIQDAAARHGYKQLNFTGNSISFVHSTRKGERFTLIGEEEKTQNEHP